MTRSIRAVVVLTAGALALTYAGSAFSALNPKLLISTTMQPGNSKTTIDARVGTADDAVARMQVFVPAGFKLDSPAGGVDVGTVTATAQSKQIGPGTEMPFKMVGKLTAIPVNDPAVSFEHANCDPVTHAGAWMARVQGGGDSWSFVVFVDATSGAEAQLGPYKLVACFKSVSGANMDPLGNKFTSVTLALDKLTAPRTPGSYRWRSLWTPFAAGETSSTLNTAATVEAQSLVKISSSVLTIGGKRATKGKQVRITISGQLLVDAEPLGKAVLALRHGATRAKLGPLASVTTDAAGKFAKVVNLTGSQYFQAGATLGGNDLGTAGCTASFGSAIPCVSATNGKVAVVSRLIHFAR